MNQRLTVILSVILGLLLMGIWLYIVDFDAMLVILKQVKILFIFPLGACFILIYFLRSLRWKIILSPVEKITITESFHLCMTNYFVNFLIPVHAGEVAKSYLLKKMKGTPISKSLWTVYLDKVSDLLPVFLLVVATPFLTKQINNAIYLASTILLLVLLFLIFSLMFFIHKKDKALSCSERIFFFLPGKFKIQLRNSMSLFLDGLSSIPRLSSRLLEITGLTLLALIVHSFFMWLFFYAFGISLPVLTVFVGYLLLNASFILPAPPGFAGSLELIFIFIFSYLYGYDKNIVSAVAASSHVVTAILFGLIGFWSIAHIGTKLSTVLKIESENSMSL